MSANAQYSLDTLCSAIQEGLRRFQEDNRDTLTAIAQKLAKSEAMPELSRPIARLKFTEGTTHSAPEPLPAYCEWTWDEGAEGQADLACLDDL